MHLQLQWGIVNPKIDRELINESNKISGKDVVLIYSNTSWSGEISGGDLGSSTKQGNGDAKYTVSCGQLGLAQGLIQNILILVLWLLQLFKMEKF